MIVPVGFVPTCVLECSSVPPGFVNEKQRGREYLLTQDCFDEAKNLARIDLGGGKDREIQPDQRSGWISTLLLFDRTPQRNSRFRGNDSKNKGKNTSRSFSVLRMTTFVSLKERQEQGPMRFIPRGIGEAGRRL
jgi:hypothetical protein